MTSTPLPPLTSIDYTFPQVWDSTMIVAARKCLRYFRNSYNNHLRPEGVAPPLLFGGTFAKGLETYRQAYYEFVGNHSLALEAAYSAMVTAWGTNPTLLNQFETKRTFERCVPALICYFENYPIETDRLQPHINHDGRPTFEYSFAVPLEDHIFPRMEDGSPLLYTGRMDTLGSYDGLPIFADEKTTLSMGDKWADQWPTRHQFHGYGWALNKLGYKAKHYLVRGIAIGTNDIRFRETPPLTIIPSLRNAFASELATTLWMVKKAFEHEQAPRNFGDACYSYFRQCIYWAACSTKPEFELGFLKTLPREKWDPLRITDGSE